MPIALDAGASIVGVNNRNLRTLAVDTDVSHQAIDSIPEDVVAVAESGLKTGRRSAAICGAPATTRF